jgi:3-phenylpropionate/trans-cinnamate dioxygenase ferredoxin reductase subunit
VIILGAGTIGTELASSLVGAGCAVTLLDQADRPLDRFLAGHLGDAASQWIRQADVDLRLRTKVEGISRKRDSWTVAADSGPIEADLVVSALGARPVIGWLAGSGLDLLNGVRCNSHGTALDEAGRPVANVHAIGDVAAWARAKGGWRRFEDWTTAQRQGRHLARCLTGQCPVAPVDHEPAYFWTHQFGRRIQVLGTPERDARLVQNIDDPDREAAFYTLDGDRGPVAWIAVNSPREFALATRQLSAAPR